MKRVVEWMHGTMFRTLYLRARRRNRAWSAYYRLRYLIEFRGFNRIACLFRGHRPDARIQIPGHRIISVCGRCGQKLSERSF